MESSRRVVVSAALVALALGVVIGFRIHQGPLPGADTRSTAVLPSASTGEPVPPREARPPARGSTGTTDERDPTPDADSAAARRSAPGTPSPSRSARTNGSNDRDARPTATATSDDGSTSDARDAYTSSRSGTRYRTSSYDGGDDDRHGDRWWSSRRDDRDHDGRHRSHDGRSSRHGGHR